MKVRLSNLEIGTKWFGEYVQWHSDKTAKTGFVGFDITYPGIIRIFWTGYFSALPGEVAFMEGAVFLRSALIIAFEPKRVVGPTKSLNESSHSYPFDLSTDALH